MLYVKVRTRCTAGVVGGSWTEVRLCREVTNLRCRRTSLERATAEGDSPVAETAADFLGYIPKYRGTREILWESGRTTS